MVMAEWLTAIGTLGATIVALYFGVRNLRELNQQKSTGFAIEAVDPYGIGTIHNQSQVEVSFRLSKYVMVAGTRLDRALEIHDLLSASHQSISKAADILAKVEEWKIDEEEILPKQTMSPQESITFHIQDLNEYVPIAFVLLKLVANSKTKYYLYRYARRQYDASLSSFRGSLHPFDRWVRIFSFEREYVVDGMVFVPVGD
jgi:hypothetical protein